MPSFCRLYITGSNCRTACKQRGMSAPALSFTVFLIKVDYFHLLICLLFFLVFLILNIICDNIGSCSISYCSNISSITPKFPTPKPVSYTHLRAHETDSYLVCRLLLEKKKPNYNP